MEKILWLASWYPNKLAPYDGDFIQRHAESVALFHPIDVIHVVPGGPEQKIEESWVEINKKGTLTEFIYYIAYTPWGIPLLDKMRYNMVYKRAYISILEKYFDENGRPPLIHIHVAMKAGIMSRYITKKWKIPYIVSEQSSLYEKSAPDGFYKRSSFFRYHTLRVLRNAICITNVSSTLGKVMENMFNLKSVKTIHNLVDTDLFFYQSSGKPARRFTWLHVSSLSPQKAPEEILTSFALLKRRREDWQLIFCGPVSRTISDQAVQLGLSDQVQFVGEVSYASVASFMKKADAFVLFSRHENFPCVVIEALCSGLPVVSSSVGGVAEAINESNGILVEPRSTEHLVASLEKLMQEYAGFTREDISRDAAAKYNKRVIGQQFTDLYRKLLSEIHVQ